MILTIVGLTSFGFANLTGLNQDLYRNNSSEVSAHLLTAIQNPSTSLKQGNIISVWSLDSDVENTFAKGYCTYGAARVSPEFFPFIDEKTQQRTWGGNAVDRCKNASDTGYKIGTTPSQGALIIYNAGGRFGSYGHVGKVLHYDVSRKKIIVRDMARVARGSMSDRREDLTTANVKCYIYNSKTDMPITTPTITTGIINTGTINTGATTTGTTPPITTPENPLVAPVINTGSASPTHPTAPVIVTPPETPVIIVPPTNPVVTQNPDNKELVLELENLSDIVQHFITQNNISMSLVSKSPLRLGEVATLTLTIKDKTTGEPFNGLLPFSFTILSTNDSIQEDISNIHIINNGSVNISLLGQKIGTASIVILIDDTKIGTFSLDVK